MNRKFCIPEKWGIRNYCPGRTCKKDISQKSCFNNRDMPKLVKVIKYERWRKSKYC